MQLEDQIDLLEVDRRLLAVRAAGAPLVEVSLELGETLLSRASRGAVAVAATNARLLGVGPRGGFRELRYGVRERRMAPPRIVIGDRVVLVQLPDRLAGLAARGGSWIETRLSPREDALELHAEANVALARTPRRVVAFSARSGGFVSEPLLPGETLDDLSLEPGSIALVTSRRLLVFRAGSRRWTVQARSASGR